MPGFRSGPDFDLERLEFPWMPALIAECRAAGRRARVDLDFATHHWRSPQLRGGLFPAPSTLMNFRQNLRRLIRRILFQTPLRPSLLYRYEYFFWPRELAFLCDQLAATLEVEGHFVEIGCARGATTVFLN